MCVKVYLSGSKGLYYGRARACMSLLDITRGHHTPSFKSGVYGPCEVAALETYDQLIGHSEMMASWQFLSTMHRYILEAALYGARLLIYLARYCPP